MVESIKNWSVADRPREKLVEKGASALTDSELLTILIGSGNSNESAAALAQKILRNASDDLNNLARMELQDLQVVKGIGPAKAITLLAAFELGRRRKFEKQSPRRKIESSKDAFSYFSETLSDLHHEEFWLMNLNRNNQVISLRRISEGGWHSTIVDPKKLFSKALQEKASAIIVAHNHPSGNLTPSVEDKRITTKLRRCGVDLELPLLDHLIIAADSYFSFADEGVLDSL